MFLTIRQYSEIAHAILHSESQYLSNKNIISTLFEYTPTNDFENIVKNRITIIDSYYSTQMSKRLYGIDDLAETLSKYSDAELKKESGIFLDNPKQDCVISSLLAKKYGIDKSGKPFGKSISLLSKYLYFLNNGNFPIYDRLAIYSYKLISRNSMVIMNDIISEHNYFVCIKQLNSVTNINDFEKLDNLLWLIGKLSKGSFGILMDKEKYLALISNKEIKVELKKPENTKSLVRDEFIRNYIRTNYKISSLFSKNQKIFFEFVFGLN